MDRLQTELHRLFAAPDAEPGDPRLAGSDGRVRAMVLSIAGRESWDRLAPVWQGVQADLQLPAPAIAVSGTDAYQLWFSLTEPVAEAEAATFLSALRSRYLADVPAERIATLPAASPAGAPPVRGLPPIEMTPGHWSAFVTQDLAALFAEETWLDLPPSPDAQADLLSRIHSTKHAEWKRALQYLGDAGAQGQAGNETGARRSERVSTPEPAPTTLAQQQDPRRFLLAVMNDPAVDLQLRIEAAKALLPYFPR